MMIGFVILMVQGMLMGYISGEALGYFTMAWWAVIVANGVLIGAYPIFR